MATTRKTSATKTTSKKVATPSAPVKPAPAAKPAPVAAPVAYTKPVAKTITAEERRRMIEEAAYYIAEKSGFTGDDAGNWAQAEGQIDAELARKGVKVS